MVATYRQIPFAALVEAAEIDAAAEPVETFDYQFSDGQKMKTPRTLLSSALAAGKSLND